MACEKDCVCHQQVDGLKEQAVGFGFDLTWVADILQNYGSDVLGIVVEAVRHGLSVKTVVDVLEKFGPALLQLLVDMLNQKAMVAHQKAMTGDGVVVNGPVVEGFEAGLLDMVIAKYLPQLLEKLLPQLLEQFGPKLIQIVLDLLTKALAQK